MSSASQDSWQDIMDLVRGEIAKQVPLMQAMKIDEQAKFVEMINNARWGEENIACFDADIAKRKAVAERQWVD